MIQYSSVFYKDQHSVLLSGNKHIKINKLHLYIFMKLFLPSIDMYPCNDKLNHFRYDL